MIKACLFDLDGVVLDTELYILCSGMIWVISIVLMFLILSM